MKNASSSRRLPTCADHIAQVDLRRGDQLLAVRVLNPTNERIDGYRLQETPHRNKRVPPRCGSSFNTGGIMYPVELAIVPAVRIADLFARPDAASGQVAVTVIVRNDGPAETHGSLRLETAPATAGEPVAAADLDVSLAPGLSEHELVLTVPQPRLWNLDDPFLYRVTATLRAGGVAHRFSVRCGFRCFQVINGWFHLNGRRLFVKSTHTGNHMPIGQQVAVLPDHVRRDLLFAKAAGFNMVRFIAGVAYPAQLDFCDEIGLMVYEESFAGWGMEDSPALGERFDRNTRAMILRDRNHPCVTIWGLLNETRDGPVFRHAAGCLPVVRAADPTRPRGRRHAADPERETGSRLETVGVHRCLSLRGGHAAGQSAPSRPAAIPPLRPGPRQSQVLRLQPDRDARPWHDRRGGVDLLARMEAGRLRCVRDGWSALRWCLFVRPLHAYRGRPFRVEAVLATEDVLPPGEYPATLRIRGPEGVAWEQAATIRIPATGADGHSPLAVPVLATEVRLDGPPGEYVLAASIEDAAPAGGSLTFHLSDPAALPVLSGHAVAWGLDQAAAAWLEARGLRVRGLEAPGDARDLILVGLPGATDDLEARWRDLTERITRGAVGLFLEPKAFAREKDTMHWCPLPRKGACTSFLDWLYHKECVANRHPVFEGLPGPGIMDWDYYGPIIPRAMFEGLDTPEETIAAGFATGSFNYPDGYGAGLLIAAYRLGAGRVTLSTPRLLANLDTHPAADRLLVNLVAYASRQAQQNEAAARRSR